MSEVASEPSSITAPIARKASALSANAITAHARSMPRVIAASPQVARSVCPMVIAATTVTSTPERESDVARAYAAYT